MKKIAVLLFLIVLPCLACSAQVARYRVKVENEYPHSTGAYTQGLFFHDGILYESAGQYGESAFRKLDLNTGKALRNLAFSEKYFLEGSVMLDGKLYILTWQNKVAFIYNAETLKYEKTCSYPREGWGITTDGKRLIASDGSSRIFFLDGGYGLQGSIDVRLHGKSVKYLNELEWIDGRIWANVYLTDMILIINPDSGNVEGIVDCSNLLPKNLRTRKTDVLNGIAFDSGTGKIYLTGKNWPRLYEISLISE